MLDNASRLLGDCASPFAELPQWTAAKACLLTLAKYDKSDIVRRCAATAATAVHSLLLKHRASGEDKEEGEKPVVEEEQGAMARSRERSRSPGRGVGFPVAGVRPRSRPHTPLRGRFASPSLPPHSPSGPSSVPTAGKAANDAVGDIRDADHPPSDAGGDDQAMNSDAVVVRHAGTTASDAVLGSTTTDQAATAVVPTAQPVDPLMDKMSSSESGFPPSGVPFDQSAYALDAVISTHRLYRVGWHKGLGT